MNYKITEWSLRILEERSFQATPTPRDSKCQKIVLHIMIGNSILIMFCPFENFDKTTSLESVFDFPDRRGGGSKMTSFYAMAPIKIFKIPKQ